MKLIDFNNSYVYWLTKQQSRARFNIDAVVNLPGQSGLSKQFVLCSGVYACNVYAPANIIRQPSYFFQLIAGDKKNIILRTYAAKPNEDSVKNNRDVFDDLTMSIRNSSGYTQILNFDDLKFAFESSKQIIALIKFGVNSSQEIIFPVRHINLNVKEEKFQVETGPVLLDDPRCMGVLETSMLPAYIAFNDFCSFEYMLLEQNKLSENCYFRFYNTSIKQEAEIKLFYLYEGK